MKKLIPTTRATISALVSVMRSPQGQSAVGTQVQKALENICTEIGVDGANPENLIPLTVEREIFDKSQVYTSQIAPLLSQVAALCDAHGVPFLFTTHVARRDNGSEAGASTFDLLHSEMNVLNPVFDLKFLETFKTLTKGKRDTEDHLDKMRDTMGGFGQGIDLSSLFGGPYSGGLGGPGPQTTQGCCAQAQDTAAPAPAVHGLRPAPEPQPAFGEHSGPTTRPGYIARPAPRPKAPAVADIKSNRSPVKSTAKNTITEPTRTKRKYTRR